MDEGDYQSTAPAADHSSPSVGEQPRLCPGQQASRGLRAPCLPQPYHFRLSWPHQAYCCATWSAGKPALGGCPTSPLARHSASSVSSVICPGPAEQADEKLPDRSRHCAGT